MDRISSKRVALAALVVASTVSAAYAQPNPALWNKATGTYGSANRSANRSLRHARDYSFDYRFYARDAGQSRQKIVPQVAREHADGLGHNIQQAQKQFADIRKQSTGDKETLASLDKIDQLLKQAAKAHAEMHTMCMQEEVDATGTMKCCQDATDLLEKAMAEQEKMMQRIVGRKPAASKK